MNFLTRESVTIALLFSSAMLFIAAAAPTLFHNTLVMVGLAGTWFAIVMTGVNRLK